MPQTPSTRWCPTPEQLMILEEMYRSGVRTPNAAEIQQITAHLAYYGRIEGKNVFYWFQNHKARERQRLRRRLCARHQQQQQQPAPASPLSPNSAAANASSISSMAAAGSSVHSAVMQLHYHHPYAPTTTTTFMPPHHLGYLGQQASVLSSNPAAAAGMAPVELAGGGGNKTSAAAAAAAGGAFGVAALYNNSSSAGRLQLAGEWAAAAEATMEPCNASCSAASGSSDEGHLPPCCRRPLKTLDLFPTKTTGLLKDDCSSSKSSSCSTSTN